MMNRCSNSVLSLKFLEAKYCTNQCPKTKKHKMGCTYTEKAKITVYKGDHSSILFRVRNIKVGVSAKPTSKLQSPMSVAICKIPNDIEVEKNATKEFTRYNRIKTYIDTYATSMDIKQIHSIEREILISSSKES